MYYYQLLHSLFSERDRLYADNVLNKLCVKKVGILVIPDVRISSDAIRITLTELINEYIRIEKTESGVKYQNRSNYVRGQIDIITSLINEKWDYKVTKQSYYNYLVEIVKKYDLQGVWRINDLQ